MTRLMLGVSPAYLAEYLKVVADAGGRHGLELRPGKLGEIYIRVGRPMVRVMTLGRHVMLF